MPHFTHTAATFKETALSPGAAALFVSLALLAPACGEGAAASNSDAGGFPNDSGLFDGGADAGPGGKQYRVVAATYLGGRGSEERIQGVTVGNDGFIYVVGTTDSNNFPTSSGALLANKPTGGTGLPNSEGYVAKLSADARSIVWATYFGGNGRDSAYGVRADSEGNVYIVGATSSSDLPTTAGAYDRTLGGRQGASYLSDAFVAKFSPSGTLMFGTYLGGDSGDENPRGSIWIDEVRGRIYVSGSTTASDFPTTSGAVQTTKSGNTDAFVAALSIDGSRLLYATFLGGAGNENAVGGVVQRGDGTLFVAGGTTSPNFALDGRQLATGLASGRLTDSSLAGDAFVARFSDTLDQVLSFSTIGGAQPDATSHNQGISLNSNGHAVLLVNTQSSGLATDRAHRTTPYGAADCLVAVVDKDAEVVAASYFGSPGADECNGIHVDVMDRVAFSGGAVAGLPTTADATHRTFIGGTQDGFLGVFASDLTALTYASYLGGSDDLNNGGGNDNPRMPWLAPDKGRTVWTRGTDVFVGGVSDASDLQTTTSALQQSNAGANDGFLVHLKVQSGG